MKRLILLFVLLLLAGTSGGFLSGRIDSAPLQMRDAGEGIFFSKQGQPPVHGWQVCEVGELVNVAGIGMRQRIRLCHSDGWQFDTYCLDPGMPPPDMGSFCSRIDDPADAFWCESNTSGEVVQRLMEYELLETPAPAEDTEAPPPTTTSTPTSISTSTPTPTPTPTGTGTTLPDTAQTQAAAQTATRASQGESGVDVILSATPYVRPEAGGPGNLEAGLILAATILLAGGGSWLLLKKRLKNR